MNKKLTSVILAGVLSVSLFACGAPAASSGAASSGAAASGSGATGGTAVTLTEAFAEGPVLLTSSGQSADYSMVGTMMKNINIEHTVNNVATSADLGDAKTVIVAVGGSSKGLGAAGVDADGEIARLTELLEAAEAAGLSIIVTHTGGEVRRGDLSDKFIAPSFAFADYAIVVAEGDADGMMSGICAAAGIPFASIEKITDLGTALPVAFK